MVGRALAGFNAGLAAALVVPVWHGDYTHYAAVIVALWGTQQAVVAIVGAS